MSNSSHKVNSKKTIQAKESALSLSQSVRNLIARPRKTVAAIEVVPLPKDVLKKRRNVSMSSRKPAAGDIYAIRG